MLCTGARRLNPTNVNERFLQASDATVPKNYARFEVKVRRIEVKCFVAGNLILYQ